MLNSGQAPVRFHRSVTIEEHEVSITDEIEMRGSMRFASLHIGDEFFARYVPQSRYFQSQEFNTKPYMLSLEELDKLNTQRKITIQRKAALSV